jgi:hypothetical protein
VQALADGLLRTYAPPSVVVIKIDNFFGPRWLRFSGKGLGKVGVWKLRLTVPPFVPHRVVKQEAFVGPTYDQITIAKPIHIETKSTNALKRYVAEIAPQAVIVWYSGKSNESGQGAMMAHVPTPDGYWPLYVRWVNRDSWRVIESLEITAEDVDRLSRAEKAAPAVDVAPGSFMA